MNISMAVVWMIAFVAFIVIEACTYQLVSVWFSIGALVGALVHYLGGGFYVQLIAFLLVSLALVCILRPASMKLMRNKGEKTNADSLVGKEVFITEAVNNTLQKGKGKINGMEWTVRSTSGTELEEGQTAKIVKIEGVKLMVE